MGDIYTLENTAIYMHMYANKCRDRVALNQCQDSRSLHIYTKNLYYKGSLPKVITINDLTWSLHTTVSPVVMSISVNQLPRVGFIWINVTFASSKLHTRTFSDRSKKAWYNALYKTICISVFPSSCDWLILDNIKSCISRWATYNLQMIYSRFVWIILDYSNHKNLALCQHLLQCWQPYSLSVVIVSLINIYN